MSDDRRPEDELPEDEEEKGLGLTEEFKRLEEEIGREGGRRDVRFDETDSSEWVAPVSRPDSDVGRETDEWTAPESLGDINEDDEAEHEGEADVPEEEPAAAEVEPTPQAEPEEAEVDEAPEPEEDEAP